ncbi:ATP SYNTHASE ALPHA CHAIN [Mycoplasmopsis pulmonis]|uniref:ATP SYNTHASE ALPHA CHAIN n=1 Tax=Mycoplasmopsis pulmonis (strain UAB CTIP) TaxID=272635 RepID=Q98PM2_MYCPU|nr:ATP F0F1 synthase subunit alpha [Mycoplasmopsis pulmonis]CAC13873.1 ATP SYNTHASE ALPHA CHAIN [Mycoplasmopsis pulmonis]
MQIMPKVVSIIDYVIEVQGKFPFEEGQFFTIKNKPSVKALVLSAEINRAFLLVDTSKVPIEIGDELIVKPAYNEIQTSRQFFGKVVNIDGEIVYPVTQNKTVVYEPNLRKGNIFFQPVGMLERQHLSEQLYTGILSIDLFNPIGRGQREIIVGDKQTGKTHIALNTIINQRNSGVKCIYVSIGQNNKNLSNVYTTLKNANALDYTIIFEASSENAFDQYLIPHVAMAHAENLSFNDDVLIVFDDLTKHANICREISLLIDKPIGKEAFPPDIFFTHSKLLERSGRFIGRKSIAALPIVKTVDGNLASLISSNLISISDGQIVTSTKLFLEGKIPAVDLDFSVSRTGSSIQKKSVAQVSAKLSKIYHAYIRQEKLSSIDYELNKETAKLIFSGESIEKLLVQPGFQYYSEEIVFIITRIITWGFLQDVKNPKAALAFILILIKNNSYGKFIYQNILKDIEVDDFVIKNFFAYALNQYFKHVGENTQLKVKQDFVDFDSQELERLVSLIGR